MSRRLISTGSPFEKTAGYSRAVIDGDFAFVSGTTGYDYSHHDDAAGCHEPDTELLQDHRSRAEGWRFCHGRHRSRDLLHHRRRRCRRPCSRSAARFSASIRPAATLLVVAGLYKPEMKVEIEVTAKRRHP